MEIGASFSVGRVAYKHDIRESIKNNVDQSRMQDNVILLDVLQGRSIEEYTNERMQPVIDAYNAKQKRKDRQITVPYTEYFNNQKDHGELSYEAVLQFGEHDTLGQKYYEAKTPEEKERWHELFVNGYNLMLQQLQKKYPHVEVLYAVIHFDEPLGTPHLHLGYQGIGDCYKQGLSQQVSIGNALACDGIERVKSRLEAKSLGGYQISRFYREFRHKYMIPLLERAGFQIKPEEHGKEHESQDLYNEREALKAEVQQIRDERDEELADAEYRISSAQTKTIAAERRAEQQQAELEAVDTELSAKKAELDQITGEARAQELARTEKLKNYKKAPLSKDMYLVHEDDIVAFENMGNTQRQLNEEKKAYSEKDKQIRQREQRCERMERQYHEYPELCRALREKEARLDDHIHEEAIDIFHRHYEGALRKMGIFEKVMEVLKKEKARLRSHGFER